LNFQKQREDHVAAKVLGVSEKYLDYFAWPQRVSSTAGPFPGIGGQAITTFTVEAWVDSPSGYAVLFCNGKQWRTVSQFDISKAINGEYR
jgi:hypothetical protein